MCTWVWVFSSFCPVFSHWLPRWWHGLWDWAHPQPWSFTRLRAPRSGQPQAQTQSGQRMDWQQPWEEGLGGVHGQEAQHNLAKWTHSPGKTQPHPGLHHKQHDQQVEERDSAPLLHSGGIQLGSGNLKIRTAWTCWRESRGSHEEGWKTSATETLFLWMREMVLFILEKRRLRRHLRAPSST